MSDRRKRLRALFAEAASEHRNGGGEDPETGGMSLGYVDFDELRDAVLAIFDEGEKPVSKSKSRNPLAVVGVTGSRHDITRPQRFALAMLLESIEGICELHHGDCTGADAFAAGLANRAGIRVVGHPPNATRYRAYFPSDSELPALPYMERNEEIVAVVDLLVAMPSGAEESHPRSGTWATVRRARALGVPTIVLMP